jgi:nifR3 family TIM-barrel protein
MMRAALVKALKIGSISLPINMIQGPLAGVSCAPFRLLTHRYSRPAFSCTEMMSCKTLLQGRQSLLKRYVAKDPNEGLVCFQLSGSDEFELAEAVKIATDCGADLIDLNCGCPVNKVRKKGAGSRLLQDPSHLYRLIQAMKNNTAVPVSIKIRVDGNSQESFNAGMAAMLKDAGNDFLIVHGRNWTEDYDVTCHYDQIQYFVNELSIPVIGNGDVACISTLKKMLATGCAGIMVSRAGVGQPWLIAKLAAELNHQPYLEPDQEERGRLFFEHTQRLADLLESEQKALFECRQFAKYYARQLADKAAFLQALMQVKTLAELEHHCLPHFNNGKIELIANHISNT